MRLPLKCVYLGFRILEQAQLYLYSPEPLPLYVAASLKGAKPPGRLDVCGRINRQKTKAGGKTDRSCVNDAAYSLLLRRAISTCLYSLDKHSLILKHLTREWKTSRLKDGETAKQGRCRICTITHPCDPKPKCTHNILPVQTLCWAHFNRCQ